MAKKMQVIKKSENPEAHAANAEAMKAGAGALTLFSKGDVALTLKRRNTPQMVKPGDVPIGEAISGEILDICDSPTTTIKGKLLWLRHESGQEFTFPVTGVIRNALAPGVEEDKLMEHLKKEIGNLFVAKRNPDKVTTKFDKKGKNMFMFDVFTGKA